ncbi:MAG: pilus assembly protein TadG-related protein [Anaerolineae bacterium]
MRKRIGHWRARLKKEGEKGQSIIMLALAVVVLLTFVGLAIDVGLLYGRRIQLSRAVDAAALAGVVEPTLPLAQVRAEQFVRTNGFDPDEANVAAALSGGSGTGASRMLTVTAQLPINTMFLHLVGIGTVEVPAMAVATFNSPVELYATQHPESGVTGVVNLSVFGKDSNPKWGDAFMGTDHWSNCSEVNPNWPELGGKYPFRIQVPASYISKTGTSEIQIEILDPDCWNDPVNDWAVEWVTGTNPYPTQSVPADQDDPESLAVIKTNDPCQLTDGSPCNENWIVRMDQHRPDCGGTSTAMETRYTLYYYKPDDAEKYPIADPRSYGCGSDTTDLKWVVPPGFRFDLNDPEYSDVMTDEDGNKSFYLDVEGLAGSYGNGFDLWAGPPVTLPYDNVNQRNVYLLQKILYEDTNPHDSGGVIIWARGYLPLNVNTDSTFTVTLASIPREAMSTTVRLSTWDMDGEGELDYCLEGADPRCIPGKVSSSTVWGPPNEFLVKGPAILDGWFLGGHMRAVCTNTGQQDSMVWKLEYLGAVEGSTYARLIR